MFGSSKKPQTKRQLSSAVAGSSLTGHVNTTSAPLASSTSSSSIVGSTSKTAQRGHTQRRAKASETSDADTVEEGDESETPEAIPETASETGSTHGKKATDSVASASSPLKNEKNIDDGEEDTVETTLEHSEVTQSPAAAASPEKSVPAVVETKKEEVPVKEEIQTKPASPKRATSRLLGGPTITSQAPKSQGPPSRLIRPPTVASGGSGANPKKATTRLLQTSKGLNIDALDETENTLPDEVNQIMGQIQQDYGPLTEHNFNPVPMSLRFVHGLEKENADDAEDKEITKEYENFCAAFDNIDKCMNIIFDDYHESFNGAVHTFSSVVEYVNGSKRLINDMRTELTDSRNWLQFKRVDLLNLWTKKMKYEEINNIMSKIEDLIRVPEYIEDHLQNFKYYDAVTLMIDTLDILEQPEYAAIGALNSIRQRLYAFKDVIHESLINELQSVIYVRSVESVRTEAAENSYSFSARVQKTQQPGNVDDTRKSTSSLNAMLATKGDDFRRQIIRQLLSTLAKLEKLPDAMSLMKDRLPLESYFVVERILSKMNDKYADHLLSSGFRNGKKNNQQEGLDIIGKKTLTFQDGRILVDFLEELYENFTKIIANVSFMFEEIRVSYPNMKDSIQFSVREVWVTVQNELKAIINEYLTSVDRPTGADNGMNDAHSSLTMLTMDSIMRDRRKCKDRLGDKALFHIGQIGGSELIKEYRELNPDGSRLSHKNITDNFAKNVKLSNAAYDEEMALIGSGGASAGVIDKYANYSTVGHQLLISPDPYNVLTIFDPTVKFVMDVEDLIDVKVRGLKNYMEEFLLNVFLPQMENRIMEFFKKFVIAPDSFATEWCTDLSPRPLCKSAVALYVLISAICKAMPYVPAHTEEVTNIIKNLLKTYYDKCLVKFQTLSGEAQLIANSGQKLSEKRTKAFIDGINGASDILSLKLLSNEDFVDLLSQYQMQINAGVGGASQGNAFLKAILTESSKSNTKDTKKSSKPSSKSASKRASKNLSARNSKTEKPSENDENKDDANQDMCLNDREIQYELEVKGEEQLLRSQMVLDLRSAQAASAICNSLTWFYEKMEELRRRGGLSASLLSPTGKENIGTMNEMSWKSSTSSIESFLNDSTGSMPQLQGLLLMAAHDQKDGVSGLHAAPVLELDNETSAIFDAILYDYKELSSKILYLLRVESRCHILYYLDLAIREGKYDLEDEEDGLHPDTFVNMLNLELSSMEEEFSKHLDLNSVKFIYDGISSFCVQVLYSNYHYLKGVTDIGVEKLRRNIQSIQQNLLNIVSEYDADSIVKARDGFQHLISQYKSLPQQFNTPSVKSPV